MDFHSVLDALVLGVLEGLTEFIPVSSTAHILLAGHFLGFESSGKVFEVVIQLGAILALLITYFHRLTGLAVAMPSDPKARRFVLGILIAFLPSVVVGVLAHDFIKNVLFESPRLMSVMLILGGIVLLWVDRWVHDPKYLDATEIPLPAAFKIGLFQLLAMIPGTSRSGSTIVGGLLVGADKRAAAEFSFFLSMPTMAGAFAFDLYKNRDLLTWNDAGIIAIGFLAAFVSALFVVRHLLDFVSRRGYALFGWWRIGVGLVALVALWLTAGGAPA